MSKKKPKSYKESWKELQNILEDLESGKLDIDKLAEKVKRASELVTFCQTRLREVEQELDQELS